MIGRNQRVSGRHRAPDDPERRTTARVIEGLTEDEDRLFLSFRWVAATAIWLQAPLVAHDRIFANVKDLELAD